MSFKDRPWAERALGLGDIAESKFEEVAEFKLRLSFERFGLQRPRLAVQKLPKRIRYMPDYLMSDKFVEVQGFGRDQTLKIKLDKMNVLHFWNAVHPLEMFVYDSHQDRWTFITLAALDGLLDDGKATLSSFPERKSYFAFRADAVFDASKP